MNGFVKESHCLSAFGATGFRFDTRWRGLIIVIAIDRERKLRIGLYTGYPLHTSEGAHSRDGRWFICPRTLPKSFFSTCQSGTMYYIDNQVDRDKIWVRTPILYEPIFWPRLYSSLLGDDANFMDIDIFRKYFIVLEGGPCHLLSSIGALNSMGPIKGLLWRGSLHRGASPPARW